MVIAAWGVGFIFPLSGRIKMKTKFIRWCQSCKLCSKELPVIQINSSIPFTYDGVEYDGSSCVKDNRVSGGWGWCPTTDNFKRDGKWESCQYCVDVKDDPSLMDESMDYYDETFNSQGEKSPNKKKNKSSREEKGFDFIRWLVNTMFFLVIFAAIGSIVFMVWRRQSSSGHQYQIVNGKSN